MIGNKINKNTKRKVGIMKNLFKFTLIELLVVTSITLYYSIADNFYLSIPYTKKKHFFLFFSPFRSIFSNFVPLFHYETRIFLNYFNISKISPHLIFIGNFTFFPFNFIAEIALSSLSSLRSNSPCKTLKINLAE